MKNISFKYLTIALEAQNEREKFSESFEKEKWIIGQKSVHVHDAHYWTTVIKTALTANTRIHYYSSLLK